jgi:hypothetical protein
MGQRFGIGQIVNGHDLKGRIPHRRSEHIPADPAKSVNSDFFHKKPSSR